MCIGAPPCHLVGCWLRRTHSKPLVISSATSQNFGTLAATSSSLPIETKASNVVLTTSFRCLDHLLPNDTAPDADEEAGDYIDDSSIEQRIQDAAREKATSLARHASLPPFLTTFALHRTGSRSLTPTRRGMRLSSMLGSCRGCRAIGCRASGLLGDALSRRTSSSSSWMTISGPVR